MNRHRIIRPLLECKGTGFEWRRPEGKVRAVLNYPFSVGYDPSMEEESWFFLVGQSVLGCTRRVRRALRVPLKREVAGSGQAA